MKTNRITPAQTCKLRNVDANTERAFIRSGRCPYATYYIPEGSRNFTYVIYPQKLVELFTSNQLEEAGIAI